MGVELLQMDIGGTQIRLVIIKVIDFLTVCIQNCFITLLDVLGMAGYFF